jgi:hypothetical protein
MRTTAKQLIEARHIALERRTGEVDPSWNLSLTLRVRALAAPGAGCPEVRQVVLSGRGSFAAVGYAPAKARTSTYSGSHCADCP